MTKRQKIWHCKCALRILLIIFCCSISLFCICSPTENGFIVYGIKADPFRDINFRILSQWLLMMSFPIILSGWLFSDLLKIKTFIVIRLKKRKSLFILVLQYLGTICFLYTVIVYTTTWIKSGKIMYPVSSVVFFLNTTAWTLGLLLLYRYLGNLALSGLVCIFLMSGCYVAAEKIYAFEKISPAIWVMPCRYYEADMGLVLLKSVLFLILSLSMLHIRARNTD